MLSAVCPSSSSKGKVEPLFDWQSNTLMSPGQALNFKDLQACPQERYFLSNIITVSVSTKHSLTVIKCQVTSQILTPLLSIILELQMESQYNSPAVRLQPSPHPEQQQTNRLNSYSCWSHYLIRFLMSVSVHRSLQPVTQQIDFKSFWIPGFCLEFHRIQKRSPINQKRFRMT